MGCKGKGDSGGNGGIRISTSDFENRLKVTDVEISVKLIQKCAMLGPAKIFLRKVLEMQRRGNQTDMCSLTSLGKYFLLPGAREELKKPANPKLGHIGYAFHPTWLTVCILSFCPA